MRSSHFVLDKKLEIGWRLSKFGPVYDVTYPWVFHQGLGWVYFVQFGDDFYFYHPLLKWCFQDGDNQRYFYSSETQSWYYIGARYSNLGFIFDYANQTWEKIYDSSN